MLSSLLLLVVRSEVVVGFSANLRGVSMEGAEVVEKDDATAPLLRIISSSKLNVEH